MGNFVLDESVFESLNRGDVKLAGRVVQLRNSGSVFWVTNETYNRLVTVDANRQLMHDLKVNFPLQDEFYRREQIAQRPQLKGGLPYVPAKATNMVQDKNGSFKQVKMTSDEFHKWYKQYGGFSQRQLTTGALVFHVKGELLTTDKQFQQGFKHMSGPVREILHQTPKASAPVDYNRTRRLLGFDNKKYTGVGMKDPIPKKKINTAPTLVLNGEPVKPFRGDHVDGQTFPGKRGEKPNTIRVTRDVPNPTGPDMKGTVRELKRQVTVAFRGVNWVIQKLNGHIQQQNVDEAMSKISKGIEAKLSANPTLGALIVIRFTRPQMVAQDNDSGMTHTHSFLGIEVGYGRTEEEARSDVLGRDSIHEVNSPRGRPLDDMSEKQWIPPTQPVGFGELPTPFAKWGLATFYPGREEVTNVKWTQALGFDDMMWSKTKVAMPANPSNKVLFQILIPPGEIRYRDGSMIRTKDVSVAESTVGMVADAEMKNLHAPCIDLDSWANINDSVACLIYPANDFSKSILEATPKISQSQLIDNFALIRFVKPEKILLLSSIMSAPIPS